MAILDHNQFEEIVRDGQLCFLFTIYVMLQRLGTIPRGAPRCRRQRTIILDLDETLVHSAPYVEGMDVEHEFPHVKDFGMDTESSQGPIHWHVGVRPDCTWFLRALHNAGHRVVVFTAGSKQYASPLLDILDPQGYISERYYRSDCQLYKGMYVKDISKICGDMRDVLIVDNSPAAFYMHPANAIHINAWYCSQYDPSLSTLGVVLLHLDRVDDVRDLIAGAYQMLYPTADNISLQELLSFATSVRDIHSLPPPIEALHRPAEAPVASGSSSGTTTAAAAPTAATSTGIATTATTATTAATSSAGSGDSGSTVSAGGVESEVSPENGASTAATATATTSTSTTSTSTTSTSTTRPPPRSSRAIANIEMASSPSAAFYE